MSIDPGLTIGYSIFVNGEPSGASQIDVTNDDKELSIISEIKKYSPEVLVYEDYIIYPSKMDAHNLSDIPTLKLIGVIEFICYQMGIKVFKQLASTGKGFVKDDKIKEWGYYLKGRPHAMDALRHGLHALLFNKGL